MDWHLPKNQTVSSDIAVVIASTGRPDVLRATVESLLKQTVLPRELIVSVIRESDFPDVQSFPPFVRCVLSRPGLAAQRNQGVKSINYDPVFVSFLDDDMALHAEYLAAMLAIFQTNPKAVLVMGHLLANGGLTRDKAEKVCSAPPDLGANSGRYYPSRVTWGGVYGCNMNLRFSLLKKETFDERLPLYSEMEDVDIGTRARRHGEVGYYFGSLAVHLKAQSGRINNRMQGFSQVMNAVYLGCKGSIPRGHALLHFAMKRPLQNLAKALFSLSRAERAKRRDLFRGNMYALSLIIRGLVEPERILSFRK